MYLKCNLTDLWHLRHRLQFWKLRTLIHDNLCDLTIQSDTGQHSQFLRCFQNSLEHWIGNLFSQGGITMYFLLLQSLVTGRHHNVFYFLGIAWLLNWQSFLGLAGAAPVWVLASQCHLNSLLLQWKGRCPGKHCFLDKFFINVYINEIALSLKQSTRRRPWTSKLYRDGPFYDAREFNLKHCLNSILMSNEWNAAFYSPLLWLGMRLYIHPCLV